MAEKTTLSINCPICLDVLREPATIPCGHNYCMGCIGCHWDQNTIYSCPLCRQTFCPRPVLRKNTMFAELVEKLRKAGGAQAAPPDHCFAGPGDVACDVCTGRQLKALKSCLQCLASYCETHLQPHCQSPAFKKHKLVQASTQLQENIFCHHDKILEIDHCTDKRDVGHLRTMDDHKSYVTVAAAAQRKQNYQSFSSPSVYSDLPSIIVHPPPYLGGLGKVVSILTDTVEARPRGEWPKISTTVKAVNFSPPSKHKTRRDYLEYSCRLTLDPNTAHQGLSLSEGNRKVTRKAPNHPYPDHLERFTEWPQVLCRECLSGRCYWEVRCAGVVQTAVSYKNISRTSNSGLGSNDKSWSLRLSSGSYYFIHNNVEMKVSGPRSSTIGVYLDHRAGTLSFYSISDTMTLLHTVQTTFTEPLHPGFTVCGDGSSAELCELE